MRAPTGHLQDKWEWRKTHLVPFPSGRYSSPGWHTKGENAIADALGACKLREFSSVGEGNNKKIEGKARTHRGEDDFVLPIYIKPGIIPSLSQKYKE